MEKDLFGNEITEKQTINRFDLEKILFAKMSNITLDEFVRMITNSYRDWETDRKSTRLNSSHSGESRMPSSA